MHELSLCRSIYLIVERSRGEREVRVVHLQVGRLRQVVPETLVYCWGLVSENTALAGSTLEVDHRPVVLDCLTCQTRTHVSQVLILTCSACGSGDISLVSGEEMLVTSLDLAREPAPTPAPPQASQLRPSESKETPHGPLPSS